MRTDSGTSEPFPRDRIGRMIGHIDSALSDIPWLEEIEQGTQESRDLAIVLNRLRAAKARLVTMRGKVSS